LILLGPPALYLLVAKQGVCLRCSRCRLAKRKAPVVPTGKGCVAALYATQPQKHCHCELAAIPQALLAVCTLNPCADPRVAAL
jgi:hypothetical protein